MQPLHVVADDLTGACDTAAALSPWPGGIGVWVDPDGRPPQRVGLVVVNTGTRTLPPAAAAERVRHVVDRLVTSGWRGIFLKKIDTGLRGSLGAEIDAVLDALSVCEAFVLPAIPEVGRTTEGGRQLLDGVPVDRTPFAHDPDNPVPSASVPEVLARTGRRVVGVVAARGEDGPAAAAAAIDRVREGGAEVVVCDARFDRDLDTLVEALLRRPRPLVLAGSVGLARALRRAWNLDVPGPMAEDPVPTNPGHGVLLVIGSGHPVAHAQLRHLEEARLVRVVRVAPGHAESAGRETGHRLSAGNDSALVVPAERVRDGSVAILQALRLAVSTALSLARPRGLLLVGGETANAVVAELGRPPLLVRERVAPLAVRSVVQGGAFDGLPIVTKGGSSGPPDLLADVLARLRRENT